MSKDLRLVIVVARTEQFTGSEGLGGNEILGTMTTTIHRKRRDLCYSLSIMIRVVTKIWLMPWSRMVRLMRHDCDADRMRPRRASATDTNENSP